MKKLLAILLVLCLLTGCQLASEEKPKNEMKDKLVGVFVTFDYMGSESDIADWLEEHPEAMQGEDIVLNFAEGMENSTWIPMQAGESEWIVSGVEGLSMGEYWNGEYWTGFTTEGFCDVRTHVQAYENADAVWNEATIYVPMDAEVMTYVNPVYQTEAGDFYVIPGTGMFGAVSSGGMSHSVSEEMTWVEDGEESTFSAKFTVAIEGTNLAEIVTVVQMDEDHKKLAWTEYVPGQLPDTFTPEKDTAYLIVEEHGAGETVRSLIQHGDQYVTVYYQSEDFWCMPDMMEILWSE